LITSKVNLLVLISLVFVASFSSIVMKTSDNASVVKNASTAFNNQQTKGPGMTYATIGITLNSLDLSMRTANVSLSFVCGFNFNDTNNMTVEIWTSDVFTGVFELVSAVSGANSSFYQINPATSSFNAYFNGGPELYPFDHYEFNVTLVTFGNLQLFQNTTIESVAVSAWPLRAQFNGPLDTLNATTQTTNGISISITFGLNRPLWQGYATLLPIYLMFALLGSITLLKTSRREMTFRLEVCLAVLTSALAYSFSIQSTLPPGRYYLSIPEALIYTVIGSLTIFIVFTLTSYRFIASNIGRIMADLAAAIFSVALLGFIFITFYTNSVIEIYPYSYNNIVITELTILPLLFFGILLLFFRKVHDMIKRFRKGNGLTGYFTRSYVDRISLGTYIIGYGLGVYLLITAWYIQWLLGASVESVIVSNFTGLTFFVVLGIVAYATRRMQSWLHFDELVVLAISDMIGYFIFTITLGNLFLVLWPVNNQAYVSFFVFSIWPLLTLASVLIRISGRNAAPPCTYENCVVHFH